MSAGVGRDRGQSTVEVALLLPFVALLLLAVVQVGLVARDQVLVVHAAREAARAAAVDPADVSVLGMPRSRGRAIVTLAQAVASGDVDLRGVDPADAAARDAAASAADLAPERLSVQVSSRGAAGSRVEVTVRYRSGTGVPLVGRLVGDVEVTGRATMRVE